MLDPERENDLFELLHEALHTGLQAGACENVDGTRHLLRDRAAADGAAAADDLVQETPNDASVVDARMLEKVLVLGREDGLDQ